MILSKSIDLPSPSHPAAAHSMRVLLGSIFLIQAGFFMMIPLMTIHFVDELGWAAAFIGAVLAIRQLTQQGLSMFGGALADRWGPKPLIMTGVGIRIFGFVLMGLATTRVELLTAGILIALGGALFDAPIRTSIAALAAPDALETAFARVGIARNLAQILGPAVGALLIQVSFSMVGFGAAVFFLLTFLAVWWGIPNSRPATAVGGQVADQIGQVWRDRSFVRFTALCAGFWFLWVQLAIALPLVAKEITGSTNGVGLFLTINSLFAVGLQIPAVRISRRYLRPGQTLYLGTGLAAIGLGTVALAHALPHLLASSFLFSLGVVLVTPNIQAVAAQMADTAARGAYLGFNALALAVGGGLGNMIGGTLLDLAHTLTFPALPWLSYFLIGTLTAWGLWRFQSHTPRPIQQTVEKQVT